MEVPYTSIYHLTPWYIWWYMMVSLSHYAQVTLCTGLYHHTPYMWYIVIPSIYRPPEPLSRCPNFETHATTWYHLWRSSIHRWLYYELTPHLNQGIIMNFWIISIFFDFIRIKLLVESQSLWLKSRFFLVHYSIPWNPHSIPMKNHYFPMKSPFFSVVIPDSPHFCQGFRRSWSCDKTFRASTTSSSWMQTWNVLLRWLTAFTHGGFPKLVESTKARILHMYIYIHITMVTCGY